MSVALERLAQSSCAPARVAPVSVADAIRTRVRSAPVRFAPARSALERLANSRFLAARSTWFRSAAWQSPNADRSHTSSASSRTRDTTPSAAGSTPGGHRVQDCWRAPYMRALEKSTPVRSAPVRSAPEMSDTWSNPAR